MGETANRSSGEGMVTKSSALGLEDGQLQKGTQI